MKESYFIKSGYKINVEQGRPIKVYSTAPKGDRFQFEVFKEVRKYLKQNPAKKRVADLGCGSAYKIDKFLKDLNCELYGIDQSFAIQEGKIKYPYINWIEDDFSKASVLNIGKFDVIISSDVIEHLVNPDLLLERIKSLSKEDTLVFLSTPERDLVRGLDSFGPPENLKHVREWNKDELKKYIESFGFKVLRHEILHARKMTFIEWIKYQLGLFNSKTCQMIVFKIDA